MYQVYSGTIKR